MEALRGELNAVAKSCETALVRVDANKEWLEAELEKARTSQAKGASTLRTEIHEASDAARERFEGLLGAAKDELSASQLEMRRDLSASQAALEAATRQCNGASEAATASAEASAASARAR